MQPIADVEAITINGKLSCLQGVQNRQRNQLFRMLKRSVVIGAVRDNGIQPIRHPKRTDKVVRRGFAGSIRRARGVRSVFSKTSRWPRASVHFVGRYVQKAKVGPCRPVEMPDISPSLFEKNNRSSYVRRDERQGGINGSIDMCFCGQVQYGVRAKAVKRTEHRVRIANVGCQEVNSWMSKHCFASDPAACV